MLCRNIKVCFQCILEALAFFESKLGAGATISMDKISCKVYFGVVRLVSEEAVVYSEQLRRNF